MPHPARHLHVSRLSAMGTRTALLVVLVLGPGALRGVEITPATATSHCSGGTVADDGFFEFHYGINGTFVQELDLPAGTVHLDQVCVCFARLFAGAPASMSFDIVAYDNDGSGGRPGTLLATIPATATSIPIINGSTQFYDVAISSAALTLPDNTAYLGARYPGGSGIVLCGDRSPSTPLRRTYGRAGSNGAWNTLAALFPSAPPQALAIRADAAPAATCTPSDTAICLNHDRFRVTATWTKPNGQSGVAHAVELTGDTGYLWFFSPSNVEAVVKVLDGCGLNSRYWVFAGGLTNVAVELTVTDTETGAEASYLNAQGTAFAPIQDTQALASCP